MALINNLVSGPTKRLVLISISRLYLPRKLNSVFIVGALVMDDVGQSLIIFQVSL